MLPPLIEKLKASHFQQTKSEHAHKYTPMLACLVSVPHELVTLDFTSSPLEIGNLIELIHSVLPGIDINDLNRFILTFQFLTNVISNVVVCDCSPAIDIRTDLTESEIKLCRLTAKFEQFINELFNKSVLFQKKINFTNL
jgi:hypothetical protein